MVTYNLIYNKTLDYADITAALESAGAVINAQFESLGVVNVTTSTEKVLTKIVGILAQEKDVSVNPEVAVSWQQLRVSSQYLPMKSTYAVKNTGTAGIVYLIDSGVDLAHPEFEDATIIELFGTSGDTQGHGTAMASLIVGKTVGVSPGATIKSVKIPMGTSIPVSALLEAFDVVLTDHNATPGTKVINCSWVIAKSQILDMKINELEQAGLIVVAAAGNNGVSADDFSPVGLDTVLGVAASDSFDRVVAWNGGSSNWGPEVDITAPGIDVDGALLDGTVDSLSGTSCAAAIVAGLACQYITENPAISADGIQSRIVGAGLKDVLYRNETLYGTTPNLLVQAVVKGFPILSPIGTLKVMRGATADFPLVFTDEIHTFNFNGVLDDRGLEVHAPAWVVYNSTEKLITITPPTEAPVGWYVVTYEGLDANGARAALTGFKVGVFVTEYAELDEINQASSEVYNAEDDTFVTVYAATGICCNPANCPPGTNCAKANCFGCNCTSPSDPCSECCCTDDSGPTNCIGGQPPSCSPYVTCLA